MITPRRIDDQQLPERYLADQLTEDELDELEQYYSEHPQLLKDLQAVAGIKVGLALLRASGELEQLTMQPRRRWHLPLVLAAALLVTVIGGGLLLSQLRSNTIMAAATSALTKRGGAPLAILTTYEVQRTRSDVDVVIAKPAVAGAVKLRLRDTLEPPPATYRLELLAILADDTRAPRASVDGLAVDKQGLLNVYLDPTALDLGSYELQLFKNAAGTAPTAVNDFLLDIVAEAGEPSPDSAEL